MRSVPALMLAISTTAALAIAQPGVPNISAQDKRPASAKIDFKREIVPILNKYCVTCHGGKKPKGDFVLQFKDEKEAQAKFQMDGLFWDRVAEKVSVGGMPPTGQPKPDEKEKKLLVTWIERDLDQP